MSWLTDASANRHIKTYVKDFLDISGSLMVRNGNVDISGGTLNDISVGAGSGTDSVAIGINPTATGANTIAIGKFANTNGDHSTSIGMYSNANGTVAIGIGYYSNASGSEAVAIGRSSNVTASDGIAIGNSSNVAGNVGIAIGRQSYTNNESVAIGYLANARASASLAIGRSVTVGTDSTDTKSMGFGYNCNAYGSYAVCMSTESSRANDESISIGRLCYADGTASIAIGRSTNSASNGAIAIGYNANSVYPNCVAIGYNAKAFGNAFGTAVGPLTLANVQATAVGWYANADGYISTALGRSAKATGANSIAIGYDAQASAEKSVAIGHSSRATQSSTIILGTSSTSVGIGTSTPLLPLHVNGNILAGGGQLHFNSNGSHFRFQHASNNLYADNFTSGDYYFRTSGYSTRLAIKNSGLIGIGTSSPSKGKLEVYGSTTYTFGARFYSRSYGSGPGYETSEQRNVSLYVSNHMACEELQVFSDERIKKNIVEVPDNLSLQMIRDLPIKYYNYIDEFTKGTRKVIGFIAQEVKEIIPTAVRIGPDTIPNEYRLLEDLTWEETDDGKFKLSCDLQDCSGVNYRFEVSNDPETDGEIVNIIGNDDNTFTFDKQYSHVFVYGKEVDDFHSIDKNQIFAVGMSALQEVDRQLQAEKAKVATLESQLADVLARLSALESA